MSAHESRMAANLARAREWFRDPGLIYGWCRYSTTFSPGRCPNRKKYGRRRCPLRHKGFAK